MGFSVYRVMELDGKKPITQGYWDGVEGVKAYLIKRNEKMTEKDTGTFRLERDHNGKWVFVQNFVI